MTRYFGQQESYTKTAEIIPFPLSNTSSSSGTNFEALLTDVFTNPAIENHLKGIIEGAVMDAWVKSHLTNFGKHDDPFDAIYISELKADNINSPDIEKISKYLNIVDLSSSVTFDDEWED
ncbi:MAG: hypothetical protein PHX57_08300 [Desulfobulbaceae bacterium]|jgi:hypothetical protein|nr:hypothetical protein [Desulfobulbaceae bacterium]